MLWVLAGSAVGGAAVTLFIFSHIDDWSRDLTTNTASTDEASDDLKPLTLHMPIGQALDKLRRTVDELDRWEESPSSTENVPATTDDIHLVRTTPLLRFKDDVYVRLQPSDDGQSTTFHVRSQSRVGRGDLGQNPRNIRELLQRLQQS
jgi:uncharacterized protein (DUF1499 family)